MQTLKQTHAPILPALLAWLMQRVALALASMKTKHSAAAVAMIVARSGNPSGG